jgi:imidazolonepropionase-like amidohydrolase
MRARLLALCGATLLAAGPCAAGDLLIRHARLIDGTGARPREAAILVRNGRIAAIGPDVTATDAPVLDAEGGSVIPGLVDAHVHLSVVPGSVERGDSPETQDELRRAHLRAYLACGVTTVLDTAIDPQVGLAVQRWLAAGAAGPRFLTLGPGFVTPGGYLADVAPAVATPEEVEAHFAVVEPFGVGVKVFMESGFGPRPVWPLPSAEVRAAIVRGAARRGLPIYVHANKEADKVAALDMGAHAITHAGFYDETPSDAFVARLAASGAYLMTTFAIMDARLIEFHPERLDAALVRRTVPAVELATARDSEAGRLLARTEVGLGAPWLPRALRGLVARFMITETGTRRRLASAERAVRRLWQAGVPIVVGTDAGNWPVVPYQFHGPTTLREIELLGRAGLPPQAALEAATRVPAKMLALDDDIGTIEVGKRADLVVLRKDPLRDLRNLRAIRWTVHDGVARTPAQWMAAR